ncbi:MAG: phosphonate metabolism protein/1,5-bisphosphokinase (PRPP-forming) PhnN [Promethearchaeota archaeon]
MTSYNPKWGTLFLLIGNSGSGKDSLIKWVVKAWPSTKLPPIVPTRLITRPPSPRTETFRSISIEEFQDLLKAGALSLYWKSYGINYGVRIEIETALAQGRSVLVNVSRQIVEETRHRFPKVCVIFIKVPFHIIKARLSARGREHGIDLEERIERAQHNQNFPSADYVIDNSGELHNAGQQLLNLLLKHCSNP